MAGVTSSVPRNTRRRGGLVPQDPRSSGPSSARPTPEGHRDLVIPHRRRRPGRYGCRRPAEPTADRAGARGAHRPRAADDRHVPPGAADDHRRAGDHAGRGAADPHRHPDRPGRGPAAPRPALRRLRAQTAPPDRDRTARPGVDRDRRRPERRGPRRPAGAAGSRRRGRRRDRPRHRARPVHRPAGGDTALTALPRDGGGAGPRPDPGRGAAARHVVARGVRRARAVRGGPGADRVALPPRDAAPVPPQPARGCGPP